MDALYKIISNRSVRLMNTSSLNDRTEGNLELGDFWNLLNEAKKEANDEQRTFLDSLTSTKEDLNQKREIKLFIFSLSEKDDSLLHWEIYSSKFQGVRLAFDVSVIENYICDDMLVGFISLVSLHYNEESLIQFVLEYIQKILNLEMQKNENLRIPLIFNLYNSLLIIKKDKSFIDEKEKRLLVSTESLNLINLAMKGLEQFPEMHEMYKKNLKDLRFIPLQFDLVRGKIRSFHELNLSKIWGSALIPEIMLGSNCPQSVDELRAFLDANGLENTKITISKIPIQ